MKLQLENLSVEELKVLREDINLLLKNKHKPKYKEDTYFINPNDLFFLCILCVFNNEDDNLRYRIKTSKFNGDTLIHNVNESFINECLPISKEMYYSLLSDINEMNNKVTNLRHTQITELFNYRESLKVEFKEKLQKIVNELNKF